MYNYYLNAMDAIHSVSRALQYPIFEAGTMELLPFHLNKKIYSRLHHLLLPHAALLEC